MKNPHGVEPTRFKKREESEYAIECKTYFGPIFGNTDIYIDDNCTEENSCFIHNNGTNGYNCHPQYKSSLFVNKADKTNDFSVLDYEVYTYN